jgi:hypothetical protein
MAGRAMLLLTAIAACGSSPPGGLPRSLPGGKPDVAAMRALLARHSPTGHYIVSTTERLPSKYMFGGSTTTLTHGQGFADYITDGSPDNVADLMGTAVHEVYHAYSSLMGLQLLVDSHAPRSVDVEAVYLGRAPMLVTYSAHFPAREMDTTFPPDARTRRYAIYISPSGPNNGTQVDGVFSLLDELTAYYHASRVQLDLWPWVRDEAPASRRLMIYYAQALYKVGEPHAELELWILHYLLHARQHRPDVYQALLGNQSFRRAFTAVDDAYLALEAETRAQLPAVLAFCGERGVYLGLYQGQLTFDGRPFEVVDPVLPAVQRTLAEPRYQEMLAKLRLTR